MSFVLIPAGRARKSGHASSDEELEREIQRRVQQQLDQLREATIEEAKVAGIEVARTAGKSLEAETEQALSALREANAQLALPLAQREQDLTELVLDMAFHLARHIIGAHPMQDRDALHALVTKLLHEASTARTPQQTLVLRLHPSDLEVLKDKLATTDIKLVADPSIGVGGAMVELVMINGDPLDKTEWDARLESRLAALHEALLPTDRGME